MMMTSLSDAVVPVTSSGVAFSPSGSRCGMGLSMASRLCKEFVLAVTGKVGIMAPKSDDRVLVGPTVKMQVLSTIGSRVVCTGSTTFVRHSLIG